MDKGHRYTDKQIEALEKRLLRFYGGVSAELKKELTAFLKAHTDEINGLWERLDNGEQIDVDILLAQGFTDEIDALAERCAEADIDAMKLVAVVMGSVYAFNHNYQADKLNRTAGVDISHVSASAIKKLLRTVGRIQRKKRLLIPPRPDKMKDRLWHRIKIRYAITDGIRHGRSIPEIAQKLETVTKMDANASFRAARTACTNAENQGKLEAMYTLRDEYGVDVKKMWYATLDNRTRTEHRMIHGEVRELEEPFSNGLQFPADPDGAPYEVWNCRCTMIDVISGMDAIKESPNGMSREEWEKMKPKSKPYPKKKKK